MKKENLIIAACLVTTVFLAGIVVYQQTELMSLTSLQVSCEDVLVLAEDNVSPEVWKGFNDDGVGESNFTDYRFKMRITDTSGGWALSKISRGLMPHGWGLRYAPLNEIELTRQNPPNVTLDITLKLIDFRNHTATNSSMNVAVCLFFDGYVVEYQEASYQTEIQFFSYYGDGVQTDQIWNSTWRNDSVTQVKLADNLQKGKIKHYEMNITPYILGMMTHYGLSRVKLKHIEIFTEAYKGYSEFELYDAKITAVKDVTARILTVSTSQNYKGWIWNPTYSLWNIEDSTFILSLNNTSPSQWEAVNMQKGLLPHNWIYLGNPLDSDLGLHESMENTLLSTMRVRIDDYGFYGEQTSIRTCNNKYLPIIKVGIFLWIQVNSDYENDRQLDVEQVVFSAYRENGKTTIIENDALYWNTSPSDNDYHAQYTNHLITQNDTWTNLTIDVGKAIDNAFNHYTDFDAEQAKIRAFGFWVEGVYGYATIKVSYLDSFYQPTLTSIGCRHAACYS